jgi:drug/metabolite transporter (DMT)-like permease
MKKIMFKIFPIFLILLAGINYGLIFPLNSMAALANASYFGHAFWQTGLSGVFLLILSLLSGQPFSIRLNYLKLYFLVGIFAFSIPMSVLTLVSTKLPVSITALVMGLSPSLTYALGVLVRVEKRSILGMVGISLGLLGLLILLLPEVFLPSSEVLPWFLLALITPVCLAIANISASFYNPTDSSAIAVGAGFLLAAALATLPITIFSGQFYWPFTKELVVPTIAASAVNCLHIFLFATIVKNYGPVFFSQLNYIIVIFAAFWAFIFFNEIPSTSLGFPLFFIALGIIISGMRTK